MMPGRKRKAWCRGISPTLELEPGARSPHSPPQTMLRFLHFPCMRLSRSFSAPFSLPRPSLSILFLYLLMVLLLLCHVFHSPESCLPGSHLSQLCPSAPGSSSHGLGPMSCSLPLSSNLAQQLRAPPLPSGATLGCFFGSRPWVPVSLSVPRSDMGLGTGSSLHLFLQPPCLLLSEPHSPLPTFSSLCGHCGHPTPQSCRGGLIGVFVPRVYTWHFSRGTRKSIWGGASGQEALES